MSLEELHQKIAIYCEMNEMTKVEKWLGYADFLYSTLGKEKVSTMQLFAWNTDDFLSHGIRDRVCDKIDDETFFQIGDINSYIQPKQPRPHLDAIEIIESNPQSHAIYVVDEAAKIAYEHIHGAKRYKELLQHLSKHNSTIITL